MALNRLAVLAGGCAIALTLGAMSPAAADPARTALPRIRFTNPLVDALIERKKKAPTFSALLDRIRESDVLVFIELAECRGRGTAATQFITTAGEFRYVRIRMNVGAAGDPETALLGHELQHVAELIDAPAVRDSDAYRALYEAIGLRSPGLHGGSFETRAARDAGWSVFDQLRNRHVGGTATN